MTGDEWIRWHTDKRWLEKMRADGPPPAPHPAVAQLFQERHDQMCREREESLRERKWAWSHRRLCKELLPGLTALFGAEEIG